MTLLMIDDIAPVSYLYFYYHLLCEDWFLQQFNKNKLTFAVIIIHSYILYEILRKEMFISKIFLNPEISSGFFIPKLTETNQISIIIIFWYSLSFKKLKCLKSSLFKSNIFNY